MITIGIDPHNRSVTAVAVDAGSRQQQVLRLAVTKTTTQQLLAWAQLWPERQWAVEGATGLGRGVAQQLAAAGEPVLDVPARLAARARLLGSGNGRKTDAVDAASVAAVAQHHRHLNRVQAEDHATILRLLTERRDDVVAERTRTMNPLHVQLRDLHPGGADRGLSTDAAAAPFRTVRPITAADIPRRPIARDLLTDLRRLDTALKQLDRQLRAAVAAGGTALTDIHGLATITAARILALTGDVRRFPSHARKRGRPGIRVPKCRDWASHRPGDPTPYPSPTPASGPSWSAKCSCRRAAS